MRASILIGLLAFSFPAIAQEATLDVTALSRHADEYAALEAARVRLLDASRAQPDSFSAQIEAAELLLSFADRLRNERKIGVEMSGETEKSYRAQQADWAQQALPLADRAAELAGDDGQRARAERVTGELYAHRITGMISGMMNGPRARRHIGRALELAPEDPECNRAIGLMYLNNPRISGGDVPKAIETFTRCAEEIRDERCLVLLALAHRKNKDPEAALAAAEAALARGPGSIDAQLLLEELR